MAKSDFADAVGVVIGEHVVSIAHVRKRFSTVSLQAIASRPLEGPREGRFTLLVDFLRQFLEEHGIDEARLCVALESVDVLFGRLQLPATATENFDTVVRYELDRIFPVAPETLITQQYWRPLGVAGERVHASVIAAVRERVEQVQRELAASGFPPTALTVVPVALNDFYAFARGTVQRTGGIFYTDAGRETMVVSSRGMMVSNVRYEPGAETRSERVVRELETLVPDSIQDEIETVVDGPTEDGEVPLSEVVPAGLFAEGAAAPELRWHQAAAVGAALGQLGEAVSKLNLLPPELRKAEEGVGLRELGLCALVAVLAVVLISTIGFKNLSIGSALATEIDGLLPRVSRVQEREEENRRLLERIKLLESHRGAGALSYLRAMTEGVPATAYLTTFRFKGDRIEVDGIATNAAELISVLERAPHFKNVEFTAPTTKYLQNQERFSLRMGLEQ